MKDILVSTIPSAGSIIPYFFLFFFSIIVGNNNNDNNNVKSRAGDTVSYRNFIVTVVATYLHLHVRIVWFVGKELHARHVLSHNNYNS